MTIKSKIAEKINFLWRDPDGLGKRAIHGSFFVIFGRILIKGFQLIRTILLAHLLFPEDFGLFGLASLTLAAVSIFFTTGFGQAIIQEKNNVEKYLNSAWSVNLLLSFLFSILLFFLIAPAAGLFFDNQAVVPLVKGLSLIIILQSFENIGILFLQKELFFKKKFFYDTLIVISEIVAVIISAFILRNAWALLIGSIVNRMVSVFLSYFFHPYRPKFTLDFSGAKYLFKYSRWVFLAGIVGFLVNQGDNLMVGKLLGVVSLGYYQYAFSLGTMPTTELSRVVGNILLPFFSKIQDNKDLLQNTFVKLARIIFSVTIPASFGLLALNNEAVRFIYGARWLPISPILTIIILYGLVKAFEYIVNPLFQAVGKPQITTYTLVIQTVVMFVLIYPLTLKFGARGTAMSVAAGGLVTQVFLLFRLRKEINIGIRGFAEIFYLPTISSLLMYYFILVAKKMVYIDNAWLLAVYIIISVLVYFVILLLLDALFGKKIFKSILWIKSKI